MDMQKDTYKQYVEARAPKSPIVKDCLRAFWVGGVICTLAQALQDLYMTWCGLGKDDAGHSRRSPWCFSPFC